MFAGMLAFDVLDRLTGDWSVTNTDWFQGFYAAVIQVLEKYSLLKTDSSPHGCLNVTGLYESPINVVSARHGSVAHVGLNSDQLGLKPSQP